MILKGSQRGNSANLARHLLNARDNEHVELHELRGFIAEELTGALAEAEGIAKGTRCRQHLFSLSLSPPEREHVRVERFEAAIEMAEQKLGLGDHPRAIVFHEKEGRRHAHVVWSRVDTETMTARNMPFFKTRLAELSKELYLEHGWELPKGHIDRTMRNPLNFTLAEWQQAKRTEQDPRLIKTMFRECWSHSDDAASLRTALEERGFWLARGGRRGVVALNWRGEVYALARWSGVKTKDVRNRFGEANDLPSVEETKERIAERVTDKLKQHVSENEAKYQRLSPSIELRRKQMVERHRSARKALEEKQAKRWDKEMRERSDRLPRGLGGLWSRITGRYGKIRRQNEREAWQGCLRDQAEKDALIARQLVERHKLQKAITIFRETKEKELAELRRRVAEYLRCHEAPPLGCRERAAEIQASRRSPLDRDPDF